MRSNRRASDQGTPRRRRRWPVVVAVLSILVATELTAIASAASRGHRTPVGHVNTIRQGAHGIYVRGWAIDRDTAAPARVRIYSDGRRIRTVAANLRRSDVARAHPAYGTRRGFHLIAGIADGRHRICIDVVNYPSRHGVRLACRTVTFRFNPFGGITEITQRPGQLTAKGWAIDPNAQARPLTVAIRVDGHTVARTTANRHYARLAGRYPSAGAMHAFTLSFPITEGTHQICARAANLGLGRARYVKCVTRTVSFSPSGAITKLVQDPGGFRVKGYASDPDSAAATTVTLTANGTTVGTIPANRATTGVAAGHRFYGAFKIPGTALKPGNRTICAVAHNLGSYGKDRTVQCVTKAFNWNPTVGIDRVVQHAPGATVTGWAVDPDTSAPIVVNILADGKKVVAHAPASGTGGSHPGHMFTANLTLPDGKHTICVYGLNTAYGSGASVRQCASITLNFSPTGKFTSLARGAEKDRSPAVLKGWVTDPDRTGSSPVQAQLDGKGAWVNAATSASTHWFGFAVPAPDGEHKVCLRAVDVNASGHATGKTVSLGCKILNAIHPVAPTAPGKVGAIAGYGGARIVWTAPTSDGGAPWSGYTITAYPGGNKMTVGAGIDEATMLGLKPSTRYAFTVVATNVAGPSKPGTSPRVTTEKEPPPQTSPAPISTSRYIRNVTGGSAADLAQLRREGAADAKANPSGHGYLVVLAIGGQDESRQGVLLSATIRFVSYANIVKNLNAYVDGYASEQRPSAPVTLAIATNNDIDVSRSSGANFANKVIDPVKAHAARYPGITVAGSNDMEPGFRAGYAASNSWLAGFLGATRAPFVFTGSADGCSWTITNGRCNNGWTMKGMYHLTGGASPIRIINLPQIYNSTMAQQWRYISLTGVQSGQPRINFGGALTEYTACRQARSCGSLTGKTAWRQMWNQLNAEPKLRPKSLPYSTDLRIDR